MKTNEVLETIKARRSVRAYDRKQIPADDLNAILEAGAYAPSGMHYETWHFTAVCNTVKLEELNERIKGAFAKSDDKHLRERGHSETYCCYYHRAAATAPQPPACPPTRTAKRTPPAAWREWSRSASSSPRWCRA